MSRQNTGDDGGQPAGQVVDLVGIEAAEAGWIRQIHRWVSIAFTLAVITVDILTRVQGEPAGWVYVAPALGLALLLLTGLYLFAEPYAARWRRR